ncbi:CRISPR-associated helicase/endonuclease Cas3 [Fervidobacterium thailandense]|uniref:CRISPR-associated helicase Cas3 n=1 Tax=Fervidobacterium thailandense TaxID=1008305 RepID=A0A1E3G0A4_9BACT|nr:CRISPR-associated helicase/endonuclease Cas3 [Fervidobacterium thailandense]ODN29669.1 hypothetical protein A4H02_09500 [Fervidobacterium thailandense]
MQGTFLARPGQQLLEHLKNVREIAKCIAEEISIDEHEQFKDIVSIVAVFHDIGKYTTYFQRKLLGEAVNPKLSDHSYISAVLGAAYTMQKFKEPALVQKFAPLIAFTAILAHHGNLPDVSEEIPRITKQDMAKGINYVLEELTGIHNERIKKLKKQLEDLQKNFEVITSELSDLEVFLTPDIFTLENCVKTLYHLRRLLLELENSPEEHAELIALWVQLAFSILVDADKKDASGAYLYVGERRQIPHDLVDRYIHHKEFPDSPMNWIRVELRKNVQNSLNEIQQLLSRKSGLILTLTAPTGAGKTLTALDFALKLRKLIEQERGYTPRIIYSLPYISIIEQNLSVIEEVLGLMDDFKKDRSGYLIAHYHLAESLAEPDETEIDYKIYDSLQLLIESWDAEIIVTTFWQLLHTMIGYRNKLLKKFHRFSGSIVILDEVQTIPAEHWPVVEKFLDLFSRRLGTIFVLMTATQPLIVEKKRKELNKDVHFLFKNLNRTTIVDRTDVSSLEELLDEILSCKEHKSRNLLFIFNTITESIKGFQIISKYLENVYYLSTNITPLDRLNRIHEIRESMSRKHPTVVVSTQVVEAGVDLDFDIVVREIGPLHSIVQTCGRCNRNALRPTATVFVTSINERAAKVVYGSIYIEATKEVLGKYFRNAGFINEEKFLELTEEFFRIIKERIAKEAESEEMWKNYLRLRFQSDSTQATISDYRLIKDEPRVSIFVCKDDEDEEILEIFKCILAEKDKSLRTKMYNTYKRKIHERMLHIFVDRAKKNLPPCIEYFEGLRFINKESLDVYYDTMTGFRYTDEELKGMIIW